MFSLFKCFNKVYLLRKNIFFFKVAYSMTKFGDDMVKCIHLGLRRLDSLTVVL